MSKNLSIFFGSIGTTPAHVQNADVVGGSYRHRSAMAEHFARVKTLEKNNKLFEQALVLLTQSLALYADAHQLSYAQPIGQDPVMGDAWKDIAEAVLVLLGGERGRLDAGTLDTLIRSLAERNQIKLME